jgi:serine-type D-Ala-D-Ala carboxypeptidase (penicillin-binding protein 5/6)
MTARARALITALLALAGATFAPAALAQAPPPPAVSAPSAIVVEAGTGEVLWARAAGARRPMASATKLMTALLTVERARLDDVVPAADYSALPVESQLGLRAGERMTVADLVRGLMLESANDAAVTLAEAVSGSRAAFVRLMNRRARRLGLADTRFANPIGLDAPRHFSSARDLARLAREVRRHRFLRRVADRSRLILASGDRRRAVRTRNTLVSTGPGWVNGLKTGHTLGAGYVLVGTGTRRGATMVAVVLGTRSEAARNSDTLGLLRWGLRQFRRRTLVRAGDVAGTAAIRYRRGAELALVAGRTVRRIVPRGQRDDVDAQVVGKPDDVAGPIVAGQGFGAIQILQNGRVVGRVPLVAASSIPAADLEQKAKSWFTSPLPLLLLVAVIGGTVLVGRQLRRTVRNGRRPGDRPRAA